MQSIQDRMHHEKTGYQNQYSIDITNENNYDLVIDTTNLSEQDVFQNVVEHLRPLTL